MDGIMDREDYEKEFDELVESIDTEKSCLDSLRSATSSLNFLGLAFNPPHSPITNFYRRKDLTSLQRTCVHYALDARKVLGHSKIADNIYNLNKEKFIKIAMSKHPAQPD